MKMIELTLPPFAWQENERGEEWSGRIDNMEDAISSLQDTIDYIDEVLGNT